MPVSGKVIRPTPASACVGTFNHGIKNVDLRIADLCHAPDPLILLEPKVTDPYGAYDFDGLWNGQYRVTMHKDDNPGCGINSFDILDFTNFLIGRHCYNYPWQLIAMDVNLSGTITTADRHYIQNYILSGTPLPNSWTFVPAGQYALVTDLCEPLNYPVLLNYKDYSPLIAAQTAQDWAGIKLGDIDGSCTDCDGTGMFDDDVLSRAVGKSIDLQVQEYIEHTGDIIDIPISINSTNEFSFLAIHCKIPFGWEILDAVTTCYMDDYSSIDFNAKNRELKLLLSLSELCKINSDEPIVYIRVKTNGYPIVNEDYFELIESEAFNFIYSESMVILPLSTKSSYTITKHAISMKVYPNPSSGNTQIQYNSDEELPVQISIIDQMGRTLLYREEAGGSANWNVDVSNLPAGLYIVTLTQGSNRVAEKLMVK